MSHIREFEHLKISLKTIKSATNNFADENCIGKGGFGNVYKGEIIHSGEQSMVVFKRLDRAFGQGNPEFWKEITMLSHYKHENLVQLLGFCDESDEKILVYEYAAKRSLDLYLSSNDLTWTQRLKICIGVARGLRYLHSSETQVRVLHRDIKSSNILLDENWDVKISDFGLSKFANAKNFTFIYTDVVGTLGYCDPIYAETGFLTKESDIYSFGVVLFEVMCGRLCFSKGDPPLAGLARHCYEQNEINTITFSNIQDEINPDSLKTFTSIAYRCIKMNREERPSITDVVEMLETALGYQAPDVVDYFQEALLPDPFIDLLYAWEANEEIWESVGPDLARDALYLAEINIKQGLTESDVVNYFQEALVLNPFNDLFYAWESSNESWELSDIVDSFHLKALHLPDSMDASKVVWLMYTKSGSGLLALTSGGIHKLWKWQPSEGNPSGKSTASIVPQLWQPTNGALMSNDVNESKPAEESAACIALSRNNSYILSVSGGEVTLFNLMTFKVMTTFMPPPPAATYLAFHPQDNNIIAIGMEDSTIQIYNLRFGEVTMKLEGHQKQITGLAFSEKSYALVSSGADAQLCMWDITIWKITNSRRIMPPGGHPSSLVGETKVQFHEDQLNILVVHQSLIAIYTRQLSCLRSWSPRESLSAAISSATYSCDGLLVFTGFLDGAVGVFDAKTLGLRCRIASSAYLSASISSSKSTSYPVVITAHPLDPTQFALGMSDGSVHVIEPSDPDPKLDSSEPAEKATLALSMLTDNFESSSIQNV